VIVAADSMPGPKFDVVVPPTRPSSLVGTNHDEIPGPDAIACHTCSGDPRTPISACTLRRPDGSFLTGITSRIAAFIEALPLMHGLRVLEIGCGPGVAAREIAHRVGDGFVLAVDRSDKAIRLTRTRSAREIASGRLEFRQAAIEDFALWAGDDLFDIAFAMQVGALDVRHPKVANWH
jgi:2-polyprenyl-3-methyl-5-hydroxy-6-metoxy-1,4-benzoquinol methylase